MIFIKKLEIVIEDSHSEALRGFLKRYENSVIFSSTTEQRFFQELKQFVSEEYNDNLIVACYYGAEGSIRVIRYESDDDESDETTLAILHHTEVEAVYGIPDYLSSYIDDTPVKFV